MANRARPLHGAIIMLTALAYTILALVHATGVAWAIPAVVAAFCWVGVNSLARGER